MCMRVQPEFAPAPASCDHVDLLLSLPSLNHLCVRRGGRLFVENIDRSPDARPLSSPAEHRTVPPRHGDRTDSPRQHPGAAIERPAGTVAAYRVRTAAFA